MTTVVDLLRHGEPIGGHIYRGQLDHELTENGWQQMQNAVADHAPWQQIITSPLKRCADFANDLAQRLAIPVQSQADFMEIAFGEWEGKSAQQLESENKDAFYAFYDDPLSNTPPQAESLSEFEQRVVSAWSALLKQYQDKHILLVGHAGMMRMIISHVLQMPLDTMYRIHIPHAGISRISVASDGARTYPQLIFHSGSL